MMSTQHSTLPALMDIWKLSSIFAHMMLSWKHGMYEQYSQFCQHNYGTAQFKLDRTHMQQGHDMTHFSFHMRASLRVQARLVTSNLPCKALVYALDMCMMHACMSGMHTPNLDYACMQIASQGQWNKLYKHVYVLRCKPLVIQDENPAKEYLKLK